jgi:hypothetical protein
MANEDRSKIEDLKKTLYSRESPDVRSKRRLRFAEKSYDVPSDWEHPPEEVEDVRLNNRYVSSSMSFINKLLISSIVFFLVAIGIGAFLLFNGSNSVSANNIDIVIDGPATIGGGDPVSFDIQVENNNNIKLEVVDLSIDFPAGTANPDDPAQEMKTFRELMDDINPGGFSRKTVRAVIYGEENSKKTLTVNVEYRVAGSNAIFQKQRTYEILISSSPLTLSLSSFDEVTAGQEFDTTVTITSNSKEVLKNLLLKGSYPFGFTFISSDIKTVGDNSTWRIGDIPPGGKRVLKIRGKIDGQNEETRVFRFTIGAWSTKSDKVIGTEYVTSTKDVSISKPFITVDLALDGDKESEYYVSKFNDPIRGEITWFNNLDTSIIDAEIVVKMSGTAYDKSAVNPDQGLFRSAENTIVWNKTTTRELGDIGAGENGRVTFSIEPKDLSNDTRAITNPALKFDVSVRGKRVSEDNVPESIVSSAVRNVKVSSNIGLTSQIVRSIGPFQNTGPIPPKAEQKTTYTVIWTVYNTSSSVAGARVKSSLPPYVSWVGKIDPSNEDIAYNSVDGTIMWNIGNLSAYTGNGSRKREVAFQISLEPSISQVGQTPTLINDATLTATDDYTSTPLKSEREDMNTRLSSDPAFKSGDEVVVQ